MTDGPITEPQPDDRDDDRLSADEVLEGGHVEGNAGDEVQGMGIISGVGTGASGSADVEPADDYPPDNDGETVD